MSKYYYINGLKTRVSDHEPNEKLRGASDIELYVKSADNRLLSIENQIEYICEKRGYNIADFEVIINDWKDGSYDKDVFVCKQEEENSESAADVSLNELRANINKSNDEKLQGHTLSRFAKHPEIKALSELTGVSQSYIKKYFNIV
ncbi:hypothetical protein D0T49_04205 [Paludibacter sp. 221]|uniref:hypothetical protein n=1 Tax=Paludibacter sp. 221 TaxID=2302939 RepID=UPI0013D57633|nr:hypothetical protein [Paludibacter sp. 221]NDV46242.1 hypothetical protein [Paludibacter sp. 221]